MQAVVISKMTEAAYVCTQYYHVLHLVFLVLLLAGLSVLLCCCSVCQSVSQRYDNNNVEPP